MKKIFKYFFATLLFSAGFNAGIAQNYVAVAKDGKVYDEASAKYVTLNQNNDEVSVLPGMVFSSTEHTPGWYKIEYSPGLHAFIPDQIVASNFAEIKPGTYPVANNPSKNLVVTGEADNWSAKVDNNTYKGIKFEDILIFVDTNNQPAFSIVDLGNGPIAISYDNAVTKFF